MFLVNGIKAILVMRNRTPSKSYYDDEPKKEVQIKVCPWGEHCLLYTSDAADEL